MKRLVLIVLLAAVCTVTCLGTAFAETASFTTSARGAVVMERSSRRVLFAKNEDMRLPMASTTKIVTALTVLENCDIDDVVEIPAEACGIEGSSIYLRAGEHLTVKELLYGLMLRSGNDCAVALALHTAGSIDAFASLMNGVAADIGCINSHFVNPHGLHDDEHYTSARDLALITCRALENEVFAEIVSSKTARISNEGFEYDRVLVNKNKLLSGFEFADGVKTGFTKKAGRCFVGSATKNGMQVVAVVLNCGPMFEETQSMLQTAFARYKLVTAVPKNKICGSKTVNGKKVYYVCADRVSYPVTAEEKLTYEIDLDGSELSVMLNGEMIASVPLRLVTY